jgi:hypothetical protein
MAKAWALNMKILWVMQMVRQKVLQRPKGMAMARKSHHHGQQGNPHYAL